MRVVFTNADGKELGWAEALDNRTIFSDLDLEAVVRATTVVLPGEPKRVLIPEEGEVYVAALPYAFRSPYFTAELATNDTYDV